MNDLGTTTLKIAKQLQAATQSIVTVEQNATTTRLVLAQAAESILQLVATIEEKDKRIAELEGMLATINEHYQHLRRNEGSF